ncbi:MAG: serine--tRNA ligase [Chloroflexota bacterium]
MLDLKLIRENPELVRQALTNRREDTAILDEILELDTERRRKVGQLDNLRQQRKEVSKEREKAQEKGRALRVEIQNLEEEVRGIDGKLEELLLQVPNIPRPDVPVGKDSGDNVAVRTWGELRTFDFEAAPHWKLGEDLGIIDFERGVKISGSRFYVLKGPGARLQRSLINFMLNLHVTEHGYREMYPPFMVKRECMVGSGQLPKFIDNIYHDAEDDLWFVGTAEIPLTNLHRDEILTREDLPMHYVAYTACFRREKMSAGKDTRGIKRGHQFDKVELYKFTEPENSDDELEKMLSHAEEVCRRLGLPYRILQLCTGDLGFAAVKSYDIEVWAPGCREWLEVSSCSNCADFQARRANVRYRPAPDARPQYVHTLNGSGLALPRILIAVLENYQQADGTISVPEVLQPYMGTKVIK